MEEWEYRSGPIDDREWPETFSSHVVEMAGEPHVFGYAVESDLARHYGIAELFLLAATGELPDPKAARAFELAFAFLSPLSAGEAPVHAACLSRICGAEPTATLGVTAIALGEQARFVFAEHSDLFVWLERGGEFPERHRATQEADHASVERLREAIETISFSVPGLDRKPTRTAALISVLWASGLRDRELMAQVWILARMPIAFAEARHHRAGDLRDYPMNTPVFRYQPPEALE